MVETLFPAHRHLGRVAPSGRCDECHGHSRQDRNRLIAGENDARAPTDSRKIDIPDVTAADAVHFGAAMLPALRLGRLGLDDVGKQVRAYLT